VIAQKKSEGGALHWDFSERVRSDGRLLTRQRGGIFGHWRKKRNRVLRPNKRPGKKRIIEYSRANQTSEDRSIIESGRKVLEESKFTTRKGGGLVIKNSLQTMSSKGRMAKYRKRSDGHTGKKETLEGR